MTITVRRTLSLLVRRVILTFGPIRILPCHTSSSEFKKKLINQLNVRVKRIKNTNDKVRENKIRFTYFYYEK